jgi:hypothetical protein
MFTTRLRLGMNVRCSATATSRRSQFDAEILNEQSKTKCKFVDVEVGTQNVWFKQLDAVLHESKKVSTSIWGKRHRWSLLPGNRHITQQIGAASRALLLAPVDVPPSHSPFFSHFVLKVTDSYSHSASRNLCLHFARSFSSVCLCT